MAKISKNWLLPAVGVLIALGIFVVVYFEPQALFIDKESNQTIQGTIITKTQPTTPGQDTTSLPETTQPAKSQWVSREHQTSGDVFLTEDQDGKRYVRFENLSTDNGPDLKVYIAKSLKSDGEPIDFVDLGDLVANKGDANYLIPDDVKIEEYNHVVIWCKRFSVSFADAAI